MEVKIAVVGLGYVGLPIALTFAKRFSKVVGFDISEERVRELTAGQDVTGSASPQELKDTALKITANPGEMRGCNFFVIGVPTPVDENMVPDLAAVISASEVVGRVLTPASVIVYESTVYPGVTEEVCGPAVEKASGLKRGRDFKLAYSPERINPGDQVHTLENITKVVSAEDQQTLELVADTYSAILKAGVHRAPSIKVAEAAKVMENTQRDVNIALINELAIIFERMGISTRDVLAAAGTKWNFLKFTPGLVGGHCIGVDPYYLTARAQRLGYHPQVMLSSRRVNNGMGAYVAEMLIKLLVKNEQPIKSAKIGVCGLTFKEDVNDIRNSRVPDIIFELEKFSVKPLLHDPLANAEEVRKKYELDLVNWESLKDLDVLLLTVPHHFYREMGTKKLLSKVKSGGVVMDVKSMLDRRELPAGITYWSL